MTQEHLITPPPELVQEWLGNYFGCIVSGELSPSETFLATQAAQWGADQELEACCKWLETGPYGFSIEATVPSMTKRLRAARRPKPPSLKEQALQSLDCLCVNHTKATAHENIIRRALERLQELENNGRPPLTPSICDWFSSQSDALDSNTPTHSLQAMTDLSPAAWAVDSAASVARDHARSPIAAALRAAADQLGQDLEFYNTRMVATRDLLALADELEAQ